MLSKNDILALAKKAKHDGECYGAPDDPHDMFLVRFAQYAIEAVLNEAIKAMPGGNTVDPQWVCDELRRLGGTHGSNA